MNGSKRSPRGWRRAFDKAATDAGAPHVVQRVGSMLTLFFNPDPVHDYEGAKRSDTRLFARFFWEMLARGVYLPCSQFEAAFVSAAHTEGRRRPHDSGRRRVDQGRRRLINARRWMDGKCAHGLAQGPSRRHRQQGG